MVGAHRTSILSSDSVQVEWLGGERRPWRGGFT